MADYTHTDITRDHFAGFGMIINTTADLDVVLDRMIVTLVGGRLEFAAPLTTLLNHKSKRDYLIAMVDSTTAPEEVKTAFEKLMGRVKTAMDLRNQIAHLGWTSGRKPGRIKPISITARQTLKILGIEHNEREWSADELIEQANQNHGLVAELVAFGERHRIYRVPAIAE